MKRKPILVALALLLVVGAALWGVNYRLDHPPLTDADKNFRARVAKADSVKIKYDRSNTATDVIIVEVLDARQTSLLVNLLRITKTNDGLGNSTAHPAELIFMRKGKHLTAFALWQTPSLGELQHLDPPYNNYQLNPRFNKRLNRVLDAYLPQRVRP